MRRLTTVRPCAEILRIARSAGSDLDFTNGVEWTHTKSGRLVCSALEPCYTLIDCGLGLKGGGCVVPHADDPRITCFWLTSASSDVYLMLAQTGMTVDDMLVKVGQVLVFDSHIVHALVSRGRWSAIVQEVEEK